MDRAPPLDDLARLLAEWLVADYEAEPREPGEPRTDEQEAAVAVAD